MAASPATPRDGCCPPTHERATCAGLVSWRPVGWLWIPGPSQLGFRLGQQYLRSSRLCWCSTALTPLRTSASTARRWLQWTTTTGRSKAAVQSPTAVQVSGCSRPACQCCMATQPGPQNSRYEWPSSQPRCGLLAPCRTAGSGMSQSRMFCCLVPTTSPSPSSQPSRMSSTPRRPTLITSQQSR